MKDQDGKSDTQSPHDLANSTRVLITGANGHLGRRLIARLAPEAAIVATVRSKSARRAVTAAAAASVEIVELDYRDAAALSDAARGCNVAVHLVGILKQSRANRYVDAHECSTEALVAAARAAGMRRIVYVSILGADPESRNAALASKGRAERILLESGVSTMILRVPMVLGENDHASHALSANARRRIALLLRGASLEQPIYAGDVVEAIVAGMNLAGRDNLIFDLAGPESLSREALVQRAGACIGTRPRCVSVPLLPVLGVARLLERFMAEPPVTAAMLEVLDHDDCVDPARAVAQMGIHLTPLDAMLRLCVN